MYALQQKIETFRTFHAVKTPRVHKQEFGQYFTPFNIAHFMASLFPRVDDENIKILDPGAGIGGLSCTFLERIQSEKWHVKSLSVDAYEIDSDIIEELSENLENAVFPLNGNTSVHTDSFLEAVSFDAAWNLAEKYTHVIMNPPYKKIAVNSNERKAVRAFGLETVNLYTAFLGAAIASTVQGGYIVAIVPRSFCNGVYYKPFRKFLLSRCAIEHIHLFESRDTAFKDESVLQENIIIMIHKGAAQKNVTVTYSADGQLQDIQKKSLPFEEIVLQSDSERYINIPVPNAVSNTDFHSVHSTLKDIGIQVSTGTIVDFRLRDFLRQNPESETIPLLYSVHFKNHRVQWPVQSKKPNAILSTSETERMFAPRGYYVAVKRFSTKEEKKRIVATLITPDAFSTEAIAFENHLNVFLQDKHGLEKSIAYGLTVWLNTTYLDEKFRLFSGHTQVNATDLRNLPFPTKEQLSQMGKILEKKNEWNQEIFDCIAEEVINGKRSTAKTA